LNSLFFNSGQNKERRSTSSIPDFIILIIYELENSSVVSAMPNACLWEMEWVRVSEVLIEKKNGFCV